VKYYYNIHVRKFKLNRNRRFYLRNIRGNKQQNKSTRRNKNKILRLLFRLRRCRRKNTSKIQKKYNLRVRNVSRRKKMLQNYFSMQN